MKRILECHPSFDAKLGGLSRGCTECLKGNKTVLFVTGLCPRHCYYCPISEEKWAKDESYANEWKFATKEELFQEIRLCNSTGVGITGGDPLVKRERTCDFITSVKEVFGKAFHVHLYTSLDLVTPDCLALLSRAGLDEIRVHPDIKNETLWHKINGLSTYAWDVTVEIPVIPHLEEQTKKLMLFCEEKINFMNLNELEMSDTNKTNLTKRGDRVKHKLSHGVAQSEETAMRLLAFAKNRFTYAVHYCSSRSKDRQMAKRIQKRAKNVKLATDHETDEGTLIRGVIYLPTLVPGFGYQQKIARLSSKEKIQNKSLLKQAKKELAQKLRLSPSRLHLDLFKLRLLTSVRVVEKHAQRIRQAGFLPAFVEEYPTQDALEVQVQFLGETQ